ncbi:MAG: protein kinase [Anaerolineae bacterium]|nr:protein kinase [Anaerolineae bacterium]
MEDLTGQHFGGYELKELVGTGGMASIYKGFDEALSRWVAIKVVPILATGAAEATMLARFRLEAQAIAALRHRNILTIYGYGEERGWAYIVMEYVPGGSLKDRIKPKEPFTWQRALTIIIPVAEALAFAHNRHIIHRDIKPANILMPEEDWPLLADFGLAKMEHSTRPNLTMPGQVLGTMAYAAPEQIQEGEIDSRVDIYSLGIVLYELLSGKLPFEGETTFDFLMARLTDPPAPLLEVNPEAPPVFEPILEKALAQEPDDRYQTMHEFACDLKLAQQELSLMSTSGKVEAVEEPEPKIRLIVSPGGQEILVSGQSELVIGRAYKSKVPDIDLSPFGGSQAGVSRQHSRLVYKNNGWFIEDLGSTNGTYVNSAKIAPNQPVALKHNDLIRCGQIELHLSLD